MSATAAATASPSTPPLPTYLVALAVGPWPPAPSTRCSGVVTRTWASREGRRADFGLEAARESAADGWRTTSASAYPFGKLDQVAVPDFAGRRDGERRR